MSQRMSCDVLKYKPATTLGFPVAPTPQGATRHTIMSRGIIWVLEREAVIQATHGPHPLFVGDLHIVHPDRENFWRWRGDRRQERTRRLFLRNFLRSAAVC